MKNLSKLFFSIIFLFGVNLFSLAQGGVIVYCDTDDPDYCNPGCTGGIDGITNNTGCDLEFVWTYSGASCRVNVGAGIAYAGVNNTNPGLVWNAPCVRFCDNPCECPTGFWLIDPSTAAPNQRLVNPWGLMTTWPSVGSVVTYTNLSSCASCPLGLFKVTFTVTGFQRASLVFDCM